MTRDDFLLFADDIICNRVQNTSMHSYRNLMSYCDNIYRECVGFNDNPLHGGKFADLICMGITNAFIAGTEEPKHYLEVTTI